MKLLLLMLYLYYENVIPVILLKEFTTWTKRAFFIGNLVIKLLVRSPIKIVHVCTSDCVTISVSLVVFIRLTQILIICRLEPDRTLATKRLSGRKVNRERLSIALCANANGSHKLKPLIIGKFERPRCFKNMKIQTMPMTYRNNAKAWMITSLFQEWLREFDRQVGLKHQGQRVLLLLDNCSSHNTS